MTHIIKCGEYYIAEEAISYFRVMKEKKEVVVHFLGQENMDYLLLEGSYAVEFLNHFQLNDLD
jgi:hypothetical protein